MSIEIWFAYLLASIVLSVSPGAGAVNTMSNGMSYGFRYTLVSIVGLQIALSLHILLVAVGLGALVAQSEAAFLVIKWLGVGYLIWLGLQKFREHGAMDVEALGTKKTAPKRLFLQAVLVNLSNPKSIVFLVAFLPQFIDTSAPQAMQYLILGSTNVVVDTLVMIGYATLASKLAHLIRSERHMRLQNRLFGGVFISAGAALATSASR